MSNPKEDGTSRRDFLKLAGTAAPAAVAAAALGGSEAEAAALPVDETRIQDTAHTRAYLDSARF
ncbi:ubiquinol-cytochrome c reductase iron-sulfur subunit N-terminal domain-containing protein [Sedimentitalea todarodis]|uniref:Ubiquinol-cytochrome c reductase iron-sulfur subunit N-terminal domain-containing protein n=1 Tax=Sedimentitalea todarodis TaxID=1631240 RepID=A0ABU3VES7_9RHOB|nr:ubiquinol-cytochrome c reductase iron-sulfur subunit N-terminal domain-containing protein [Sedimentitalea todarodis]MDU9004603.1 ubiquinol-cytochrome c reductase iron-sulfur subunit N-terminal domain-containing protein [Sedimentitalea todarodis]